MGSQESLFSSWVLEGGGEAVLAELDLVLRLVVELEPGAESDHCCQSISSSPWSHVDPNNVDPLWSLVWSLHSQPPHCAASLNIEVLAPPGRAIWVKTLSNSRNKGLARIPLREGEEEGGDHPGHLMLLVLTSCFYLVSLLPEQQWKSSLVDDPVGGEGSDADGTTVLQRHLDIEVHRPGPAVRELDPRLKSPELGCMIKLPVPGKPSRQKSTT